MDNIQVCSKSLCLEYPYSKECKKKGGGHPKSYKVHCSPYKKLKRDKIIQMEQINGLLGLVHSMMVFYTFTCSMLQHSLVKLQWLTLIVVKPGSERVIYSACNSKHLYTEGMRKRLQEQIQPCEA